MPLYRALRWLLGLAMRVFFRQVEVVGLEHVPATGAVIFAGNHPNSLIDPILILVTCGRVVHFAAKCYVGESVEEPLRYYRNNAAGTTNLLQAMRDASVNRIVFSSTCAVYGVPKKVPIPENHLQAPLRSEAHLWKC